MSIFSLLDSSVSDAARKDLARTISVMLEVLPAGDGDASAAERRAVLHLYAPIKVEPRLAGLVFVIEARPLDGNWTHDQDWFEVRRPGEGACRCDAPLPAGFNATCDVRQNCSLERGLQTRKLIRHSLASGRTALARWLQPLHRLAARIG